MRVIPWIPCASNSGTPWGYPANWTEPMDIARELVLPLQGLGSFDEYMYLMPFGHFGPAEYEFSNYPRLAQAYPGSKFAQPIAWADSFEWVEDTTGGPVSFYMGNPSIDQLPTNPGQLADYIAAAMEPITCFAARRNYTNPPRIYFDGAGGQPWPSGFSVVADLLQRQGFTNIGYEPPPGAHKPWVFASRAASAAIITYELFQVKVPYTQASAGADPNFARPNAPPSPWFISAEDLAMDTAILFSVPPPLATLQGFVADGYSLALTPGSLQVNGWTRAILLS